MGFPMQFFTVLFAIPRVTGYLAHWRESLSDPDTKIIRPQQDYQVHMNGCVLLHMSELGRLQGSPGGGTARGLTVTVPELHAKPWQAVL